MALSLFILPYAAGSDWGEKAALTKLCAQCTRIDAMEQEPRYRHVQALERGLQILLQLNRMGRGAPAELAKACGLDRTTTYRLMATLEALGFIGKSASDNKYVLLPKIRLLSDGFTEFDETSLITSDVLSRLLSKVVWPSDYATFSEGSMVIQETTHRFSPYSVHRAMVGRKRPLLRSSLGRAYLAVLGQAERDEVLSIACSVGDLPGLPGDYAREIDEMLDDYDRRGYAWSVGGTDVRISAIALPVCGPARVFGSVNIVFFRSALTVEDVSGKYLPYLRDAVDEIGQRLNDAAQAGNKDVHNVHASGSAR